jgi:hypothetical protein
MRIARLVVLLAGLVLGGASEVVADDCWDTGDCQNAPNRIDGTTGIAGAMAVGAAIYAAYRALRRKSDCVVFAYIDRIEFDSEAMGLMGEHIGPSWNVSASINGYEQQWQSMTAEAKMTIQVVGNLMYRETFPEACGGVVTLTYRARIAAGPNALGFAPSADVDDASVTKTYVCADGLEAEERLSLTLGLGEAGGPGVDALAKFVVVFTAEFYCGEMPESVITDPRLLPGPAVGNPDDILRPQ